MQVLRVGFFSRSPVLALAEASGALARRGLSVQAEAVASSPAQYRSVAAGEYDLVLTSPDNVIAYRVGDANPLHERVRTRVVGAADGGLGLVVTGRPGLAIEDLHGGTVGVDVVGSGFAFALFAFLEAHGLGRGDYELVELGSTPRRAAALAEGRCDATLLNGGFPIAAVRRGAVALGRISEVVDPYLGTVLAARDEWIEEHDAVLASVREAWAEAVGALLDPGRRGELAPLVTDVLGVPADAGGETAALLADPREGLVPDGLVDPAALDSVLRLRREHAAPPAAAAARDDPEASLDRLVDPRALRHFPATEARGD